MQPPRREDLPPLTPFTGAILAKNSLWNLVGWCAPLLGAVFAIPLLIKGMGTERFGVLMLMWMGIGYFSLFDVGLSQALTKLVAEKLGTGRKQEIPKLVWTALAVIAILSVVGALLLASLSPWLAKGVLRVPESLRQETLISLYLLAASIPLIICSAALCGVLEAHQRFDLVNAVRVPAGLLNFLSPLPVLLFSQSLVGIVAVLMVGRVFTGLAYLWLCLRAIPSLRTLSWGGPWALRPLLSLGGWMTVSNVVGPLMVYMDRFLIGALASMSAVAFYTTPYEMVIRLTVIPLALGGVLFPAFSICLVEDRKTAVLLFDRALSYVFLSLFPVTLIFVALAGEGLKIWLGAEFARNSTGVLRWLAVGVFINSLARIPFTVILAAGRPDMTAKLHLAELPLYLLTLGWLLTLYGIEGAAIAWVLRVSLDAVVLFAMAHRFLPDTADSIYHLVKMLSAAVLILSLFLVTVDLFFKTLLLLVVFSMFFVVAWFFILKSNERHLVRNKLKMRSFASAEE
jgi:O-antigen/teichoic acid export membrane protein